MKGALGKAHPFPYYGEGSARPIREKDGLLVLVVFNGTLSPAAATEIAASAPAPLRADVKKGRFWLALESSDVLAADIRAWARAEKITLGKSADAAYAHLGKALTTWTQKVHREHPVALLFVGSDGKRGSWHTETVKRFADAVRPVIERLRAAGANDHADWITASFLRDGATGSFEDIRGMAEEDGPQLGDIGQRFRLAMPLVAALGTASLSALGPYGELGFWASAPASDLVTDPGAHATRLVSLADACPKRRVFAVQRALVIAARRLVSVSLDAALVIASRAARSAPLTVGMLDLLVDAARKAGGAKMAVAIARPFLQKTVKATNATPRTHEEEAALAALFAMTAELEKDVKKAPDDQVKAVLAVAPKPAPKEQPVKGATHPHLARLNTDRLTVSYRGSLEPQLVTIELKGSGRTELALHYARNVERVVDMITSGLAGAGSFAPEVGEAEIVKAPAPSNDGPDFAWKLRVRGVGPCFWAVALDQLANPWNSYNGTRDVNDCARHISIVGDLPIDGSSASARTKDVVAWLRNPAQAFQAWPEPPFEVVAKAAKSPAFVLKPRKMSKSLGESAGDCSYSLVAVLEAHPKAGRLNGTSSPVPSKTQVRVPFYKLSCPSAVARGPVLNMARRIHFRVTPLTLVELAF